MGKDSEFGEKFGEKFSSIQKIHVCWQEIYEAAQKSGKNLSIDGAKRESSERYDEARILLLSLTKLELISLALFYIADLSLSEWRRSNLKAQLQLIKKQRETIRGLFKGTKTKSSARALKAAEALHSKPGGSRAKADAIRSAWASGKYTSRDRCAEEECAALDMSLSAARKALRNTPAPS